MPAVSIYDYLSYREFLRAYYEERKSRDFYFSYRYMARKTGMDHSLLVKVVLGKRHLSAAAVPAFCKLCKLLRREAQYFENLVRFEKARSEKESKIFLEKLFTLKGYRSSAIEKDRYEYFQKWYYAAVRAVIDCGDFNNDYTALARRLNPPVTPQEAKAAVALLARLDFIRKGPGGRYCLTDAHVTTGEQWEALAIKDFQKQTILLSADSLDRDPKHTRDISSLTMSLDIEAFEDVREIIRECRAAIIRRIDQIPDSARDRVYQLNIQCIPLTRVVDQ
jgi:uncharacterized protein (TIGR02147 family)